MKDKVVSWKSNGIKMVQGKIDSHGKGCWVNLRVKSCLGGSQAFMDIIEHTGHRIIDS